MFSFMLCWRKSTVNCFLSKAAPLYFSFVSMLSTTAEPHFFLPAGVGSPHLHKCVRNNPTNIVSDSFYFFNGLSVFISFCVLNKIAYKANDIPTKQTFTFRAVRTWCRKQEKNRPGNDSGTGCFMP